MPRRPKIVFAQSVVTGRDPLLASIPHSLTRTFTILTHSHVPLPYSLSRTFTILTHTYLYHTHSHAPLPPLRTVQRREEGSIGSYFPTTAQRYPDDQAQEGQRHIQHKARAILGVGQIPRLSSSNWDLNLDPHQPWIRFESVALLRGFYLDQIH